MLAVILHLRFGRIKCVCSSFLSCETLHSFSRHSCLNETFLFCSYLCSSSANSQRAKATSDRLWGLMASFGRLLQRDCYSDFERENETSEKSSSPLLHCKLLSAANVYRQITQYVSTSFPSLRNNIRLCCLQVLYSPTTTNPVCSALSLFSKRKETRREATHTKRTAEPVDRGGILPGVAEWTDTITSDIQ